MFDVDNEWLVVFCLKASPIRDVLLEIGGNNTLYHSQISDFLFVVVGQQKLSVLPGSWHLRRDGSRLL